MIFVDDVSLMDGSREVQDKFSAWTKTGKKHGLKLGQEKSEVIIMQRSGYPENSETVGTQLKMSHSFNCQMRSRTTRSNDKEITSRIQTGKTFYRVVKKLPLNHKVPLQCKEVIYLIYYFPVLIYDCENWTVRRKDGWRNQVKEMIFVLTTVGKIICDKIKYEKVRNMAGFGHMQRMDVNGINTNMYQSDDQESDEE